MILISASIMNCTRPTPTEKRIKLIEGSSISQDVIDQVKSMISEDATVMVMLDSNHSENHVLRELGCTHHW